MFTLVPGQPNEPPRSDVIFDRRHFSELTFARGHFFPEINFSQRSLFEKGNFVIKIFIFTEGNFSGSLFVVWT